MLWLCCKFILGNKLAYWRACLEHSSIEQWVACNRMEKTEGRARILPCSFLFVRNKLTLIVASRTELQATSAILCLKNIDRWWDEAPCESCSLLADRCVPRDLDPAICCVPAIGFWLGLLPSSLPSKLHSVVTWTVSLSHGHSSLPLKKSSYFFEISASTHNTALCGSPKDRNLFVIDCF
jgi:hypothetical protein